MVSFVRPLYSKSKVKAAGKRIVEGRPTSEDVSVLENFRAAHSYVLNTFQINARRHSAKVARTVGQRLKRRNTIIDKLGREPSMPLYAMHDIAGCRMIFDNQEDLYRVRMKLREARFEHVRTNELDKYDYIKLPKSTGYRGVHDVYEYMVKRSPGAAWNGLKVELQFRTQGTSDQRRRLRREGGLSAGGGRPTGRRILSAGFEVTFAAALPLWSGLVLMQSAAFGPGTGFRARRA